MEKSSTDGYIILLMGFARSPIRVFESYLRIVVSLDEEDIELKLKQQNSNFVTYEILPGVYSFEVISKAVYTMRDLDGTLQIQYDDVTMKTKPILVEILGRWDLMQNLFFLVYWILHHIGIINLLLQFMLIVLVFLIAIKF